MRYINNEPVVLEKTFMDATLITGINHSILEHSIYDYIESTLKLKISSANKIILQIKAIKKILST